jgi:hypothetical protein
MEKGTFIISIMMDVFFSFLGECVMAAGCGAGRVTGSESEKNENSLKILWQKRTWRCIFGPSHHGLIFASEVRGRSIVGDVAQTILGAEDPSA